MSAPSTVTEKLMPLSLIESSQHIVLIAHKNPDADSLGSASAFYSYILRLQKKVTLFCSSPHINPHLGFLPWFDKLSHRFPEDADLLICFDCGSFKRLGMDTQLPLISFDHHVSNDFFATKNVVNTAAISTTEVVYDFFVTNDIKINGKIAQSLYAGLVDDSRCFSAPECNEKTFELARALIAHGADHAECVSWLYHRKSLSSLRIRGALLKQMKLLNNGKLALFEVSQPLLDETGAKISECKEVLEEALSMRCVQASLLVAELPSGEIKISLRTDGEVNASEVLSHYGGGGHAKRAGAQIKHENHREFVQNIMSEISKELV